MGYKEIVISQLFNALVESHFSRDDSVLMPQLTASTTSVSVVDCEVCQQGSWSLARSTSAVGTRSVVVMSKHAKKAVDGSHEGDDSGTESHYVTHFPGRTLYPATTRRIALDPLWH